MWRTTFLKGRAWTRTTKAREISSEIRTEERPLGFINRKLIGKNQDNVEIKKKRIPLWSVGF